MSENLKNINVDFDKYIASYEHGTWRHELYQKIKCLLGNDLLPAEIGKELISSGLPVDGPKYSNLESYRSTVVKMAERISVGAKTAGLNEAERVDEMGLFPMNADHHSFRLMTLLASLTFWNGALGLSGKKKASYQAVLSLKEKDADKQEALFNNILSEIGCHYKKKTGQIQDSSYLAYDARIARLIHLMGFEPGKKNENQIHYPEYIRKAVTSFNDFSANQAEKHLAYDVIHDFVLSLLYSRTNYDRFYSALHSFKQKENAEYQSEEIEEMAWIAFPGVGFSQSTYYFSSHKSHIGRLVYPAESINKEQVDALMEQRVKDYIDQHRGKILKVII